MRESEEYKSVKILANFLKKLMEEQNGQTHIERDDQDLFYPFLRIRTRIKNEC